MKERGLEDADWIHVAEETHQWWSDVNKGMYHKVPKSWRQFLWLAENTIAQARGYNANQNTSKSFLVKAEIQRRSNRIRFPPM